VPVLVPQCGCDTLRVGLAAGSADLTDIKLCVKIVSMDFYLLQLFGTETVELIVNPLDYKRTKIFAWLYRFLLFILTLKRSL